MALNAQCLTQAPLDAFSASIAALLQPALQLSQADAQPARDFAAAMSTFPVADEDAAHKMLLVKLAQMVAAAEQQRAAVLGELNTGFALPMKQFLRVEVSGTREMQDRLEQARQNLDEAQLRFDIARTSNKKKAVVDKLAQELESCKRQHSLLKVNVHSKGLVCLFLRGAPCLTCA